MLETRATADELMDAEDLDPAAYAAVLRDLAQVNTVTMSRRPTIAFLNRVRLAAARARMHKLREEHDPAVRLRVGPIPLKILDVGFGDGDMLRTIADWARSNGVSATLVGIDLNPNSAAAARKSTPLDMEIDYRTGDYASLAGEGWDVVISSLVAHHMTHDQLIAFLRFMEAEAKAGWFVNDLHRHGFAWLGFPLLAGLLRWHPIVRHDGRLSIARSYRPHEWQPLLAEAGIKRARVFRAFPFRLCVERLV
jgi:2-polyprenyl-3-methyl-5-hydroxy-6-metoxy-1,4-benzoquinol methylase